MLLIVKPESVIDVITNSSSELFVCKTELTVSAIENVLRQMLTMYSQLSKHEYYYESVFGELSLLTKDNLKEFLRRTAEYGQIPYNPPTWWDLYELHHDVSVPAYEDHDRISDLLEQEFDKWFSTNEKQLINDYVGSVCVYSADDNSVPYELFDMIESLLGGYRIHLG